MDRKVSPDELRAKAAEFEALAGLMETLITDGNDLSDELSESWQSDGATKFASDWEEVAADLAPIIELIMETATRLVDSAEIYEQYEADQQGA